MSGARRTLKELAAELNTLMKEAREGVVPLAEAKAHLLRVRGQVRELRARGFFVACFFDPASGGRATGACS